MSAFITNLVIGSMVLFVITVVIQAIITRFWKWVPLELIIVAAFAIMLHFTTGFPVPQDRLGFGGVSPFAALGIMFVCTLLGIAAQYMFYLEGQFSWKSFFKPLFISPIVFLPLVGSVQGVSEFEPIQLVSFAVLAFQNGFFWKVVLDHAKDKIQ
jgi:hypothetical protein